MAEIHLSRRDFLTGSAVVLGGILGVRPLGKLYEIIGTSYKEQGDGKNIDLSVIFSAHVPPQQKDWDHLWPNATRRVVDDMQYDVIGSDSICYGHFYNDLGAGLPLNNPNQYHRFSNSPLYVVSADLPIKTYIPDAKKSAHIAQSIWNTLMNGDSTFAEVSPEGVNNKVNKQISSRQYDDVMLGAAGIINSIVSIVEQKAINVAKHDPRAASLTWPALISGALSLALTSRQTLENKLLTDVSGNTTMTASAISGQLVDAIYGPFQDTSSYLTLRNCRVSLATIDFAKLRASKEDRPIRAGLVFGNAHIFGEYPAQQAAFGWREPISATEERLVSIMKGFAQQIIIHIKDELPTVSPEIVYRAVREFLGQYDVYEIPQTRRGPGGKGESYEMNIKGMPVRSVDTMLRDVVEKIYKIKLEEAVG